LIHLGVDSRDIFAAQPRGVGKALTELVRHLLPLIPDWAVTLYTDRNGTVELSPPALIKQIDMRGDRFDAWERIRLPIAALTSRLDLLHCPSQTAPPFTPCPVVLTVHDLIPLRIDDGWSRQEVDRFRRALSRSAEKARRIIAVSEFTRDDLLSEFRVPENKIDVIPWGVHVDTHEPMCEDEWKAACQTYGIRSPFFVAFGGDAPRKNVTRILKAMAIFTRTETKDAQLVLIGVPPHTEHKVAAMSDQLGISKEVVALGYLPDKVASYMLMRSEALVYPSLYEGFGLPILEAMALGTPVISSNVTSMPEVARDAAILIDPRDESAICAAMRECFLSDRVKGEFRARGFRRVEHFTWERTARLTLDIYKRAL
jgi:glycosyltransferase involved in cell wall biosynthesis